VARLSAVEARKFASYVSPTWLDRRGCVIRAEAFELGNFNHWWDATDGEQSQIEYGINHVHLWDVMPDTGEDDRGPLDGRGDNGSRLGGQPAPNVS
jgi:hypothetical protein